MRSMSALRTTSGDDDLRHKRHDKRRSRPAPRPHSHRPRCAQDYSPTQLPEIARQFAQNLAKVIASIAGNLRRFCWRKSSLPRRPDSLHDWRVGPVRAFEVQRSSAPMTASASSALFPGRGSHMGRNGIDSTEERLRAPCQDAVKSICRSCLAREEFGSCQSISGEDS